MIDQIVILKLVNDKEIIGKYTTENDFAVFIKDPLEVQSVYDVNSGFARCVLGGYMSFAASSPDVGIGFPKIHILHFLPVKPVIEKYYTTSLSYIAKNKNETFEEETESLQDNLQDIQFIHKNQSKSIH